MNFPHTDDPRWLNAIASSTANFTNMRSSPSSATGRVIERIAKNEAVFYMPEGAEGFWVPVIKNGIRGWVHGRYVAFSKPDETPINTRLEDEIKRIAFEITSAWEGGGYGAYQTYDTGIVSYGKFQFTLSSGNLFRVLRFFVNNDHSDISRSLQSEGYLKRVKDKDRALQDDGRFKELLIAASKLDVMRKAQLEAATLYFWNPVQDISVMPRNIQRPLSKIILFDMAINHGLMHGYMNTIEDRLGIKEKSRIPDNGIDEKQFIREVSLLRQQRMYAFADKNGFPGLKPRVDFFVDLINSGNWGLEDDIHMPSKNITVKGLESGDSQGNESEAHKDENEIAVVTIDLEISGLELADDDAQSFKEGVATIANIILNLSPEDRIMVAELARNLSNKINEA